MFKFTPKYPEEAPEVKIESSENTSGDSEIIEFLKVQAMENIGMPMIYTLVCALIEKLNQDICSLCFSFNHLACCILIFLLHTRNFPLYN